MKKRDFKKLALLGITGAIMMTSQGANAASSWNSQGDNYNASSNQGSYNGCNGYSGGRDGYSEGRDGYNEGRDGYNNGRDGYSEGRDGYGNGQMDSRQQGGSRYGGGYGDNSQRNQGSAYGPNGRYNTPAGQNMNMNPANQGNYNAPGKTSQGYNYGSNNQVGLNDASDSQGNSSSWGGSTNGSNGSSSGWGGTSGSPGQPGVGGSQNMNPSNPGNAATPGKTSQNQRNNYGWTNKQVGVNDPSDLEQGNPNGWNGRGTMGQPNMSPNQYPSQTPNMTPGQMGVPGSQNMNPANSGTMPGKTSQNQRNYGWSNNPVGMKDSSGLEDGDTNSWGGKDNMGQPNTNPSKYPTQTSPGQSVTPGTKSMNPANPGPTGQRYNTPMRSQNQVGMTDSGRGGHSCGGKSGCGGQKDSRSGLLSLNDSADDMEDKEMMDSKSSTATNAPGETPMSDDQFSRQLNAEGKKLFNSLSPEGKQLAIRLSKQYSDKNQAVKHAARQLNRDDSTNTNKDKRQGLGY